jgi:hypothetical protein
MPDRDASTAEMDVRMRLEELLASTTSDPSVSDMVVRLHDVESKIESKTQRGEREKNE